MAKTTGWQSTSPGGALCRNPASWTPRWPTGTRKATPRCCLVCGAHTLALFAGLTSCAPPRLRRWLRWRRWAYSAMLTGDGAAPAQAAAAQLSLNEVRAGLLPQDKLRKSKFCKRATAWWVWWRFYQRRPDAGARRRRFCMVAAGLATALEAGRRALMDDDPRKLVWFIRLAGTPAPCCGRTSAWRWG